jgi:serine protease Do
VASGARANAASAAARRDALGNYLFKKNGFHGSRTDYGHRANSHLDRVIDDREGLPITLSVLYMELGRRMSVKVHGIGLPGNFVVRVGDRHIDPFDRGRVLSQNDLERMALLYTGRPLRPEHLEANTTDQIAQRMLNNLVSAAQVSMDREALLRYLEALVALRKDDPGLRGMRGVVRFETGRQASGVADLDWILKKKPEGLDLNRVQQMRDHFQGQIDAALKAE